LQIEFDIEIFNPVYVEAYNYKGRILNLYGSAGSGKSIFAGQKKLIRLMSEKGHKFLFCRKVAKTIRDSQFALFKDIISQWNLTHLFRIYESKMDIQFLPNKNWLVSSGLDDPEKLKSIHGITGAWIEEATELEERDLRQINLRLRGKTNNYKQIILSYNPIDDEHWINKKFFTN
jgi:phage terminase large subunit